MIPLSTFTKVSPDFARYTAQTYVQDSTLRCVSPREAELLFCMLREKKRSAP
jgi:hypothetical protein